MSLSSLVSFKSRFVTYLLNTEDEYKVLNSKQATLNLGETTVFFTIVNNS